MDATQGANEPDEVEVEEVDLEQFALEGRKPPKAKVYKIKVNDTVLRWTQPMITGRQVLELANLLPVDKYRLRLKIAGSKPEPIGLDDVVDLRRVGVEKFRAIRQEQTEGEYQGRRDAPALDQDRLFLDSYGLPWEIVNDGSTWVLIHNFPLPSGFTAETVTLAVRIEGGYPMAALDMMYVYPMVGRADGGGIRQADVMQLIDGKNYQRWSRHRTELNPWVSGQDSLETHIYLVEEFFRTEVSQ